MLYKLVTFTAFVYAVSGSVSSHRLSPKDDSLRALWEAWKTEYGKTYSGITHDERKFATFKANLQKIEDHNDLYSRGESSFTMRINKFADLNEEEFADFVHGDCSLTKRTKEMEKSMDTHPIHYGDLPASVDWTTVNPAVVNPIKNQGQCGSCWAFSATGATESAYAIKEGTLNDLSEQEVVDCSHEMGNSGCQGGFMDGAFEYIIGAGGLSLESAYPYKAHDEKCRASDYPHYSPLERFTIVGRDNMTALMSAVAMEPVSIGIEADQTAFQFYSSGIMDGKCGTNIDHGVIAVGYGIQGNDKYWKVRNSWGTDWGEEGYIRMCRDCGKNGDKGECCILCQPSYPNAK